MNDGRKHLDVPKALLIAVALITVIGIVAMGCGGSELSSAPAVLETGAGNTHEEEGSHTHEEEGSHDHEATVAEGVNEVVLTATEWAFDPETITLTRGEPVTLIFVNDGLIEHDIEIEGLKVTILKPPYEPNGEDDHEIATSGEDEHNHEATSEAAAHEHEGETVHIHVHEPGEAYAVEFIPLEAGTYRFACTLAGHEEAGMVGQLVVES